ncbi:MAG: hypothetical protein ABW166_01785 [Sedimenticola sp.]
MRIGVDFDNTIAGYDRVFNEVAKEWGLLREGFEGGKREVRDALRRQESGTYQWQRLQGLVYGKYMGRAVLLDGVASFFQHAQEDGAELFIVSHKTRYGHHDSGCTDLRLAARQWMEAQGFFSEAGLGLNPGSLYFEGTRSAKVARIGALECDCFIDDLAEVFFHPDFPSSVDGYLYAPSPGGAVPYGIRSCRSWSEIEHFVLGERA